MPCVTNLQCQCKTWMCFESSLKWNILASQISLVLCSHLGWMEVARFPWTMSMITLCLRSLRVNWIKLCLLLLFVCVQGSLFLITFPWQVASDQWTSVIAWQIFISRYCCTLVSALEAGNGDAWSEGQDSLGQDGRVLPWRGECPVFRNGWLRWMLRSGMGKLSALGTWSLECFPCTWHLITWLFLNSFAYPKFSQMFPKTSFFSGNIFFLTFGESRQY